MQVWGLKKAVTEAEVECEWRDQGNETYRINPCFNPST